MEAQYNKITQTLVNKRLETLLQNEELIKMGIKIIPLGKTTYNYPIDMIQIGHGEKEIFIVGGTHSSEVIGTDFITQLIGQLPNMEDYDPNKLTLKIIPIQNPEGFDVVEQAYSNIDEPELEKKGKEFFTRYKIDNIIYGIAREINELNPKDLQNLKQLIAKSERWEKLQKVIPKVRDLVQIINESSNYIDLLSALRNASSKLGESIEDIYIKHFIEILISGQNEIGPRIDTTKMPKLYQKMFENVEVSNLQIRSPQMKEKLKEAYALHPKGSIIGHDSTGIFINLNANHLLSPGIEIIQKGKEKYMTGAKSNIRNYIIGPNGLPCVDVDNFEYSIENQILYELLRKSNDEGKYLATFLYHGTGGLIYYMPHEPLMKKETYDEFVDYNTKLVEAYNNGIVQSGNVQYKPQNLSDTTGFGDELSRTFKGVLMVELSRMGGNPIAPYGDRENINRTINENISALNSVFKHFSKGKTK